jgi:hypothetical protein
LKAIFFVEPLLLGTLSSVPLSKGCTLLSSCRGGGASVCARGGAGGSWASCVARMKALSRLSGIIANLRMFWFPQIEGFTSSQVKAFFCA